MQTIKRKGISTMVYRTFSGKNKFIFKFERTGWGFIQMSLIGHSGTEGKDLLRDADGAVRVYFADTAPKTESEAAKLARIWAEFQEMEFAQELVAVM